MANLIILIVSSEAISHPYKLTPGSFKSAQRRPIVRIELDDSGDYIVFHTENDREEDLLGHVYLRLAEGANNLKLEGTLRCEPIRIRLHGQLDLLREGHTECDAKALAVGVPETPKPKPKDPGHSCYYCLDGCELCTPAPQVYEEPDYPDYDLDCDPDNYDW
jgi:hypothetical protein